MNNSNIYGKAVIGKAFNKHLKIHGNAQFHDTVEVAKISVDGQSFFHENVTSKQLVVNGSCTSKAKISCADILVNGTLSAGEQGIDCEIVKINGVLKTNGNLKASDVSILGTAYLKSITAKKVSISGKSKLLNKIIKKPLQHSIMEQIRADIIYADDIHAEIMIGNDITLGANCMIDRIECSGKIIAKKGAVINNASGVVEYI